MTEEEIYEKLDNSNDGYYFSFVELGDVYSYLIDTRLNVFTSNENQWAIAVERLGYNPRAAAIILQISYYGNCLINLEYCNERQTNYYNIYPIDTDNFNETVVNEAIKPEAKFWLVRGQQVSLSHEKTDYLKAEITLKEYEPNEICVEEAARLAILTHRDLFRATDKELYKSIPTDLNKILVIDEWYHKDFNIQVLPSMTDDELEYAFEFNKTLGSHLVDTSLEDFIKKFRQQEMFLDTLSRKMWKSSRPSSYETWQQIAKVIVTNNKTNYNPSMKPNTHWKNWKNSSSM
jgi:hypothetical protein